MKIKQWEQIRGDMGIKKKHLGEKLSLLAKSLGVSQTELAERVGIPSSQVNRYFRGHSEVYSTVLVDVLRELGFDIEEMITKRLKNVSEIEVVDTKNTQETVSFLFNELDDLGKQTYLSHLLWAAKVTKGSAFPKKLEDQIRKEISLI